MSSLDIIVTFNEIPIDNKHGFIQKKINNKNISFTDQLICLKKSIEKNWKSFNGNFFALYSENLSEECKHRIEKHKISLYKCDDPKKYNRINNRLTAYSFENNSDYSLILDTDMIFLKEPNLEFICDMYMSPEGIPLFERKTWEKLFSFIKHELPEYKENCYELHEKNGESVFCPHMNNGCILVKNSYKKELLNKIQKIEDFLYDNGNYLKINNMKHFFSQIAISLAFHDTKNKKMFNRGINFISVNVEMHENVSLYHYLGSRSNKKYDYLISEFL